MPTNEELIQSQLSGVVLHRLRSLNPLGQEGEDPLLDLLFSITRPPPAKKKRLYQLLEDQRKEEELQKRIAALKPEGAPGEHIEMPKGMVSYRRERYGEHS